MSWKNLETFRLSPFFPPLGLETIIPTGCSACPSGPQLQDLEILAGCSTLVSIFDECLALLAATPGPGGPGGNPGGGGASSNTKASPANNVPPQSPPPPCQAKILNATNNQFGTNYTDTNVSSTFNYSTGASPGQGTLNLNVFGSTAGVSPGYYPVHWWTYASGYGPTLHAVSGPGGNGGLDSTQTLQFGPNQATFHIDSGFPYNPIGALFHWLLNMTKAEDTPHANRASSSTLLLWLSQLSCNRFADLACDVTFCPNYRNQIGGR